MLGLTLDENHHITRCFSLGRVHIGVDTGIGVVMILPQVHLRKPCYDFTFL
jgi:hypothetical protein